MTQITISRNQVKQWLEALRDIDALHHPAEPESGDAMKAIADMELALAQPEPVCDKDPQGCWNVRCQLGKKCKNTPPQRTWVGLIPEQVQFYASLHRQLEVVYYDATLDTNVITETFNATDFYQQVESVLKELNS